MSAIRQRKSLPKEASPLDELLKALQERTEVSVKQLTNKEFGECLSTAAEKLNISLKYAERRKPGQPTNCCCYCLKVIWACFLLMVATGFLVAQYEPATSYLFQTLHTKIYDVVRPMRLGLLSIVPFSKAVGIDIFGDCVVENSFLNATQQCVCMHTKEATEVELNGSVLPVFVYENPKQLYVLRNVLDSKFSLEQLQDFHRSHEKNPPACIEIGSEGHKGPVFYQQLFDKTQMLQYLKSNESWSFTWEECPDPATQLSFRSLLHPPSYLPHGLYLHSNSIFSISTQWGLSGHIAFSLDSPITIVNVLEGEVRFYVSAVGEHCYDYCSGLTHHPVLKQGDMMVFDEHYWTYQLKTWSNFSITFATSLMKTPPFSY